MLSESGYADIWWLRSMEFGNNETAIYHVAVILDPLTSIAQKWSSILSVSVFTICLISYWWNSWLVAVNNSGRFHPSSPEPCLVHRGGSLQVRVDDYWGRDRCLLNVSIVTVLSLPFHLTNQGEFQVLIPNSLHTIIQKWGPHASDFWGLAGRVYLYSRNGRSYFMACPATRSALRSW